MMNRNALARRVVAAAAIGVLAWTLAGCTSSGNSGGTDGSRVKLYNSVSDVAGDSSIVVSGLVDSQTEVAETSTTSPYVASTLTVTASYSPAGLAANVAQSSVKVGDKIVVRQIGTLGSSSDTPYLTPKTGYLLFLAPTGLAGAPSNNYYVTGATAGLYKSATGKIAVLTAGSASFSKEGNEGDKLPATLSASDLQ